MIILTVLYCYRRIFHPNKKNIRTPQLVNNLFAFISLGRWKA